jgi:uncharacterized protein YjhX (UPF0386 family)
VAIAREGDACRWVTMTAAKGRRSIVGCTVIVKGYRRDGSDFAQTFKVQREISGTLVLKSRGGCTYRLTGKTLEGHRPRRLHAADCWIELPVLAGSLRRARR